MNPKPAKNKVNPDRKWEIDLRVNGVKGAVTASWIKKTTRQILNSLHSEKLNSSINQISLLLTNDKEMRIINREYRKKDKTTDVLSFPTHSPKELRSNKKGNMLLDPSLGDLVISLPTAKLQAKKYEVTLKNELTRLLIHGILHLCGYDHEKVTKNEAQKMRRKEASIMFKLVQNRTF